MTLKTITARYKAWQAAKDEQWKRAWEFADAVAEYATEAPRTYARDISEATGQNQDYVRKIKRTALAYPRGSRNVNAAFRVHMAYVEDGRGGEWVPDDTTLRDVKVPEAPPSREVLRQHVKDDPELRQKIVSDAVREQPEQIARQLVEKQPQSAETLEQSLKLARHGKLATPSERKATNAIVDGHVNHVLQALHPLAVEFGVVGMLDAATARLDEIVGEGPLTPDLIEQIEAAYSKFGTSLEVAKSMAGIAY